jgi:hypothetical protein
MRANPEGEARLFTATPSPRTAQNKARREVDFWTGRYEEEGEGALDPWWFCQVSVVAFTTEASRTLGLPSHLTSDKLRSYRDAGHVLGVAYVYQRRRLGPNGEHTEPTYTTWRDYTVPAHNGEPFTP